MHRTIRRKFLRTVKNMERCKREIIWYIQDKNNVLKSEPENKRIELKNMNKKKKRRGRRTRRRMRRRKKKKYIQVCQSIKTTTFVKIIETFFRYYCNTQTISFFSILNAAKLISYTEPSLNSTVILSQKLTMI